MAYITFQPSDYFNTLLYSGNSSTQALTGLGFEPDLVWIKNRDGGAGSHDHYLFDQVRGTTKHIRSNGTNAEGTASGVTSFDSDGFTLGSSDGMNETSRTFASWNWKANGSGSANTDGSINTTYTSANTTSGVSIIQYTGNSTSGATIGHGLGVAPSVYFCKKTNSAGDNWIMYHSAIGATKYMVLNATDTEASNAAAWNNTAPTSSVITLGNGTTVNGNTDTFIGYAFAEKKGFSKFGSYTGNGSATDNTFVYTGFKPAFLLIKRYDTTEGWQIFDNKRDPDNVVEARLEADSNGAEHTTVDWMDLCSNGFKIRYNGGGVGTSGGTYIYMAFAEHPLVSSNDIPATAR